MENIKVTPNYSARTFTIRRYDDNGKAYAKYRTLKMSREEFESSEFDTEKDWENFLLRCDGEYYRIN